MIYYGNLLKVFFDIVEIYFGFNFIVVIFFLEEDEGDVILVLNQIFVYFIGLFIDGVRGDGIFFLGGSLDRIGFLGVKLMFLKVSLFGEGVSFIVSVGFDNMGKMIVCVLGMEIIRFGVLMLVGVNFNEWEVRQMLVVMVGIEGIKVRGDRYVRVEKVVVKVSER